MKRRVQPIDAAKASRWVRRLSTRVGKILATHPDADRDNVRHTLILLEQPPLERLQRSLIRGRATCLPSFPALLGRSFCGAKTQRFVKQSPADLPSDGQNRGRPPIGVKTKFAKTQNLKIRAPQIRKARFEEQRFRSRTNGRPLAQFVQFFRGRAAIN